MGDPPDEYYHARRLISPAAPAGGGGGLPGVGARAQPGRPPGRGDLRGLRDPAHVAGLLDPARQGIPQALEHGPVLGIAARGQVVDLEAKTGTGETRDLD